MTAKWSVRRYPPTSQRHSEWSRKQITMIDRPHATIEPGDQPHYEVPDTHENCCDNHYNQGIDYSANYQDPTSSSYVVRNSFPHAIACLPIMDTFCFIQNELYSNASAFDSVGTWVPTLVSSIVCFEPAPMCTIN